MSEIANNNYSPTITITSATGEEYGSMKTLKEVGDKVFSRCENGHVHVFYNTENTLCKTCLDSSRAKRVRELAEIITDTNFMLVPGGDLYISYELEALLVCMSKTYSVIPEKYRDYKKIWLSNHIRMSDYQIIAKICTGLAESGVKPSSQYLPPNFIPFSYLQN